MKNWLALLALALSGCAAPARPLSEDTCRSAYLATLQGIAVEAEKPSCDAHCADRIAHARMAASAALTACLLRVPG